MLVAMGVGRTFGDLVSLPKSHKRAVSEHFGTCEFDYMGLSGEVCKNEAGSEGTDQMLRCRCVPRTQRYDLPLHVPHFFTASRLRDSRWLFSIRSTGAFCGTFDRHDPQQRPVLRAASSGGQCIECRCDIPLGHLSPNTWSSHHTPSAEMPT